MIGQCLFVYYPWVAGYVSQLPTFFCAFFCHAVVLRFVSAYTLLRGLGAAKSADSA